MANQKDDFPNSYKDTLYASLDAAHEQKLGLPVGSISSIRMHGERSNHDATNELGTKTVYQFTPSTRKAILNKYGIDVTLSPQNASEGAGLLLKESLDRNQGDLASAVGEYIGGTDRKNWGSTTKSYVNRVMVGQTDAKNKALESSFSKWMAENPASPSSKQPTTGQQSKADPAKADPLADAFGAYIAAKQSPTLPANDPNAPRTGVDAIPVGVDGKGQPVYTNPNYHAPEVAPPTFSQQAVGAGEAALNTVTGMTGGAVGMAGGMVKGMAQAILDGTFGTPQAANMVEQEAMKGAEALTYQPRTQTGQQYTENVGQVMNQMAPIAAIAHTLPPMVTAAKGTPGGVMARAGVEGVARDAADLTAKPAEVAGLVAPGAVGDAAVAGTAKAANAVATGAQRVSSMAQGVTTLPRRALAAISGAEESTPTRGTLASGGSAGTDVAAMRKATADQLPVPMGDLLTKGDLTRDPAQQKFEVETAKLPEEGKPLRERIIAKNQALLENLDNAIDQTGAEAPTLRAVGAVVDKALVDKAARAKTEIRARYKAAENAGEMEQPVTLQSVVDHLNESAPDAATAPLLTTARARAIQTGMAVVGPDGQLVAQPISLKRAETFRQAVGAATDYTPTNIRQSAIIKALVDEATQGMGGDLYRQARAARARYAQEFEDHAVISKLLNNKRGTADRQVAFEDVFNHAIKNGSLDDVRTVRKTLQTAGSDGMQAWKELQGATLRDIRDRATQGVALDSAGNRVLNPGALDKAITALDADGKLDFIFGKKGAQTLRDIREIAQISKTVSPEAAINHSNTAMTLAAFADTVFSGLIGGPAPVATSVRFALQHVKDVRLRNRIREALNEQHTKIAPNNKGGAPKKQAPSHKDMH